MAPVESKPPFDWKALGLSFVVDYPLPTLFLAGLGALGFAKFTFSLLRAILQIFVLPGYSLKRYGAKKGAWAVITGATDGIGREFAVQLAKAGFNVALVSRSAEKLGAVAAEIESKYKVSTKTHAIDFGKPEDSAFDDLKIKLAGLDIGVLVNNVGKSHDIPVNFHETAPEEIAAIIQINITSTLRLTQIVLPSLINRKGQGLVLNIGSFAASVPSPMLSTYAGSKGFLTTWSQALGEEVKQYGVLVQLVNTFFVVSAMSKIRKPNLMTPLPSTYVRSVLSHIGSPAGALGRPYTTTPYWSHAIADWAIHQVGSLGAFITYSHGLQQNTRKRALKKRAREQEAKKAQ